MSAEQQDPKQLPFPPEFFSNTSVQKDVKGASSAVEPAEDWMEAYLETHQEESNKTKGVHSGHMSGKPSSHSSRTQDKYD